MNDTNYIATFRGFLSNPNATISGLQDFALGLANRLEKLQVENEQLKEELSLGRTEEYFSKYRKKARRMDRKAKKLQADKAELLEVLEEIVHDYDYGCPDTGNEEGIDNARRLIDKHTANNCRKCNGEMKPSKGLIDNMGGIEDFPESNEVCTVSANGTAELVDCMKCCECGWSVTGGDKG